MHTPYVDVTGLILDSVSWERGRGYNTFVEYHPLLNRPLVLFC